jgi:hypothetical protein
MGIFGQLQLFIYYIPSPYLLIFFLLLKLPANVLYSNRQTKLLLKLQSTEQGQTLFRTTFYLNHLFIQRINI